ncbi:cornifelin homolog A-like [Sardina pilchardus]|uniref:cornifelin homolog A-like n=1 Tax=Sardina pilchardus TaxID=27697 RepID=UPI002E0D7FE8
MQNPRKGAPTLPVSGQPKSQQAQTANVCVSQKSRWSSTMMNCCADKQICCCGLFCSPILACRLSKKYGECFCQPLLPGGLTMLRSSMRQRYNIEGSILDDAAVVYGFGPCALCQMMREYNSRNP